MSGAVQSHRRGPGHAGGVSAVTARPGAAPRGRPAYVPLFWRLFVPNATVLAAACVVLMVEPANGRVVALAGGLATMLVINLALMRRAFAPLARLTALMGRVDPLRPGRRLDVPGPASEVTVLAETFNAMLDRLEHERRQSGRRALEAQENDRRHLAAELHDEVGQTLTAMVLQLDRIADRAADGVRADAVDARDTAIALTGDIRAIVRRLRPEVLDDLGLAAALRNLVERVAARTDLHVERRVATDLPAMSREAELVIYRIAQEALTNALRHARASRAWVDLRPDAEGVVLVVGDDGVGFDVDAVEQGGIRHMRERAMLIGADLVIHPRPAGPGSEVVLRVGWEERRRHDDADDRAPAAG